MRGSRSTVIQITSPGYCLPYYLDALTVPIADRWMKAF